MFVSHVYIASIYAHMFSTMSTNYDIWLIAGETQFTHATQDLSSHMLLRIPTMEHRNRRGERLDRRTTTLHSTLLPPIAIPRSLFTTPYLTSACSHRRDGCTNRKTSIFYTMLVQKWETTSAWTGQTWQHYKAELLRVRGIAVMSTTEYQTTSQMGVLSFLR